MSILNCLIKILKKKKRNALKEKTVALIQYTITFILKFIVFACARGTFVHSHSKKKKPQHKHTAHTSLNPNQFI